jgi:hypothetical protein
MRVRLSRLEIVTPASWPAICGRLASVAKARGDCLRRTFSACSSAAASGSATRVRTDCAALAISGSTSLRLSAMSRLVKASSLKGDSQDQARSMLVMLPCSKPSPFAGAIWSTPRTMTATLGVFACALTCAGCRGR